MSTPFLGEVKIFSFNFAPKGWAACNGTMMSISQNQALFPSWARPLAATA